VEYKNTFCYSGYVRTLGCHGTVYEEVEDKVLILVQFTMSGGQTVTDEENIIRRGSMKKDYVWESD
jgi:hypothetical protein